MIEAVQYQTHENNGKPADSDFSSKKDCSNDDSASSDMDEMTAEVNFAPTITGSSSKKGQSIKSFLLSSPLKSKSGGKAKPKNHCYFRDAENKEHTITSNQDSGKVHAMHSPEAIQLPRIFSICKFREIANRDLNLNQNFVQKDVILTESLAKQRSHIEQLTADDRLNNKPCNYKFDREVKDVAEDQLPATRTFNDSNQLVTRDQKSENTLKFELCSEEGINSCQFNTQCLRRQSSRE